jgi:hypothetical protein
MYPKITTDPVIHLIVHFSTNEISDVQPAPLVQSTPPTTYKIKSGEIRVG